MKKAGNHCCSGWERKQWPMGQEGPKEVTEKNPGTEIRRRARSAETGQGRLRWVRSPREMGSREEGEEESGEGEGKEEEGESLNADEGNV